MSPRSTDLWLSLPPTEHINKTWEWRHTKEVWRSREEPSSNDPKNEERRRRKGCWELWEKMRRDDLTFFLFLVSGVGTSRTISNAVQWIWCLRFLSNMRRAICASRPGWGSGFYRRCAGIPATQSRLFGILLTGFTWRSGGSSCWLAPFRRHCTYICTFQRIWRFQSRYERLCSNFSSWKGENRQQLLRCWEYSWIEGYISIFHSMTTWHNIAVDWFAHGGGQGQRIH